MVDQKFHGPMMYNYTYS